MRNIYAKKLNFFEKMYFRILMPNLKKYRRIN